MYTSGNGDGMDDGDGVVDGDGGDSHANGDALVAAEAEEKETGAAWNQEENLEAHHWRSTVHPYV